MALPVSAASAATDPTPCWCEADAWQVRFRTSRFGIVQCAECDCYRLDPRPLQRADAVPTFYSEFYERLQHASAEYAGAALPAGWRFWRVVEQVAKLGAPGASVADIGCGDGGLCAQFYQVGWRRVVGVDVSEARIRQARERYPAIAFHTSLEEAALAPESLDLIVLDNVLEHLLDPPGALGELRRYLRPGGRMVLITPNMKSGHFRLLGRRWTPELSPDQHIFLFTSAAMRRLLFTVGLQVDAIGSIQLPPFPFRTWLGYLQSGQLKEAVWRVGQELGTGWGRLIRQGPMLFAVARAGASDTSWRGRA